MEIFSIAVLSTILHILDKLNIYGIPIRIDVELWERENAFSTTTSKLIEGWQREAPVLPASPSRNLRRLPRRTIFDYLQNLADVLLS